MVAIKEKMESALWHATEKRSRPVEFLLRMASGLYGAGQKLRAAAYRYGILETQRLPCPVISIGNITVGGTGKTPMTIYVTRQLLAMGFSVVVISRGYKGAASKVGGIAADGEKIFMGPESAGDEPYMMAHRLQKVPVIVACNRFAGGLLAVKKFRPDVLILDDAFQHLQLARDIDLVLLDADRPFANGNLLPGGGLREPLSALGRAAALVLTRCPPSPDPIGRPVRGGLLTVLARDIPVFRSWHMPYFYCVSPAGPARSVRDWDVAPRTDFEVLEGKRVYAFAGIARNDDFKQTISGLGCDIAGFQGWADHHRYSERELSQICRAAEKSGAQILLTTEKDHARLAYRGNWPLELVVVGVKISFGPDERRFSEFLRKRLAVAAATDPARGTV